MRAIMNFIVFVLIIVVGTASGHETVNLFRKCCPVGSGLVKVSDSVVEEQFLCHNSKDIFDSFNTTYLPLVIGSNITVTDKLPVCDTVKVNLAGNLLTVKENNCFDRLVTEVINGSVQTSHPRVVELFCSGDNTQTTLSYPIRYFRKCCPIGEAYDRKYHLCRKTSEPNDPENIMKDINVNDDQIYELEFNLNCKSDEYAMELSEQEFSFSLQDGLLKATRFSDNFEQLEFIEGDWCVERSFRGGELLVRGCSKECLSMGALCLRKCCPVGFAFRPFTCNSVRSGCVPYPDEEALFDLSDYFKDKPQGDNDLPFAVGLRTGLQSCDRGKYVLNRSVEPYYLSPTGELGFILGKYDVTREYCIESFDRRHCKEPVTVEALRCFVDFDPNQDKNYLVSAVTVAISCVFLSLTLVVYCLLPELRNLHGRTLICHVTTMLLAMICLATVQFSVLVKNIVLCQLLGYGIYFGFVAAFSWLNVMCLDIWWTFGSVRSVQPFRKASAERRRFIWYSVYAWSVAVTLTLVMFLLDRHPINDYLDANIGINKCWFGKLQNKSVDWPYYIFFVIPMGVLTCTNFVLWLLTARHCNRVKSEVHRLQAGSKGDQIKRTFRGDKARYILTGKLWVVMGASWISELLSTFIYEPQWLWFVIDRINELQGVSIFIVLVLKPKLYYLIRKKLGFEPVATQTNATSSAARTSSSLLSRSISNDERNNRISAISSGAKQDKNI